MPLLPGRFRRNRRRGFSLLELLAVVTILGVIAAIVLYRTANVVDDAKQKVQMHHLTELNTAIEHYYMVHETWPATLNDLVTEHFPDGIPDPPTGGTYGINATTHRAEVQ
jgi:general secretion pathway protein G